VQLTTDGLKAYLQAVDLAFSDEIDYAILHKLYGPWPDPGGERRYSPPVCIGTDGRTMKGTPTPRRSAQAT
jgi:hypothetical protein